MKIVKMKQDKMFALAGLSFSEIKVIKDACEFFAQQGSNHAAKLAQQIDEEMGNMTI